MDPSAAACLAETCPRSASTCAIRCTCAAGCVRRTSLSVPWARCNGACASSAASPAKAVASASARPCSTLSSPGRAASAYPTSIAKSYAASSPSVKSTRRKLP